MMTWKEFGRTLLWHNGHYEGAEGGGVYVCMYVCMYVYVCVYIYI
jgi:hypothetical protein